MSLLDKINPISIQSVFYGCFLVHTFVYKDKTTSKLHFLNYITNYCSTVWMGGLFNPEAFVTATRQCVAQANTWSLEELSLDVTVADEQVCIIYFSRQSLNIDANIKLNDFFNEFFLSFINLK